MEREIEQSNLPPPAPPANDLLTGESRAPINVSRVDGTVQCRAFLLYIADVFVFVVVYL